MLNIIIRVHMAYDLASCPGRCAMDLMAFRAQLLYHHLVLLVVETLIQIK